MSLLPLMVVSSLVTAQQWAMVDECEILTYTSTRDAYGQSDGGVTGTVTSICGIEFTGGEVKIRGVSMAVEYDAIIRLPIDATVLVTNNIRLIKSAGKTISVLCEVFQQPQLTSSAQKVKLKRITP